MENNGDNQTTQTHTNTEAAGATWYAQDGIDPALVTDKVKSFGTVNDLLKSYNNAQSLIGRGIPDDNAPPEVRDEFLRKLGRPDSPEGYNWTAPEGFGIDEEPFKNFQKTLYDLGLSKKQADGIFNKWISTFKGLQEEQSSYIEQTAKRSREVLSAPDQWGDDYDVKLNATYKLIEDLGLREPLMASGLYQDVRILKGFNAIVSASKESQIKGVKMSGGDLAARESFLKNHPAFMNSGHPDHKAVIDEFNELARQKHANN